MGVTRKRVVSGMRPTGRLHLGHLVGALQNWVDLQRDYDCFYFVADWHALTSDYADTSGVVASAYDMVAAYRYDAETGLLHRNGVPKECHYVPTGDEAVLRVSP